MEPNPFEPPRESADTAVAPPIATDGTWVQVYTADQAALATFIGSPVAGAWLIASNYDAMDKHSEHWRTILVGLLTTAAVFAIAFLLPAGIPVLALPIAYTFAVREAAKRLQGADVDRILAAGGTKHSAWRATGVGCLGLLATIVVMVFLFLFIYPGSVM